MCCLAEFCVLSFPWRICSICWSYSPYEIEKIVHLPLFYCKCLCRNALGWWNMTLLIPLNSTGYAGWQERTISKSGCCTESRRVDYISRFCHFWYNHEWKAMNGVGVLQYLQPFWISQKSRTKLVWILPWRKKVGWNPRKGGEENEREKVNLFPKTFNHAVFTLPFPRLYEPISS